MKRLIWTLLLVALCSSESAVIAQGPIIIGPPSKPKQKQVMNLLEVGTTAPEWQLTGPGGTTHSLSSYRGKVVVMDFWATWCGPCTAVMPRMQKLQQKFADKGVVVVGINSWENGDAVGLMKEKGYSYELLLNGERIAEAYKVKTLPVVYIVGSDGKIIYCHEGEDQKDLGAVIEKYFKEKV
jgi:thiol-disulfide isomerase/thioredoxin